MSVSARVSLILAVQEHVAGPFPAVRTYPASFERRVAGDGAKVFAASGEVQGTAVTLDVPSTLSVVHYWMIENLADPTAPGTANVNVAGGPADATVPRGQVVLATNDATGWPAAVVTITGTPGTPYKVIALGE